MLKILDCITALFKRNRLQIRRHKIYVLLRSLNLHIKTLVAENPTPRSKEVRKLINDLYQLKEDVLLKLLRDGHLRVRYEQRSGRKRFYVLRATREITFHLPANKTVKAAVKRYEEEKTAIRPG